jgi:tripartite-type tricarboxylate transporter receptor subunit TctC
MSIIRRIVAVAVAVFTMSMATPGTALSQGAAAKYPNKPVRVVVPFPPGASNDIIARLLAHRLTEFMGQQFVVDNRPGAGGLIGGEIAASAAPDGHTLLFANPAPSINSILMSRKPPYHMDDFAPVMFIGYVPLIMVSAPSFPPNDGKQLLAYAKANPGKVNWASSGNGSSLHVGLALFQAATGADVVHVPYKGTAPALTDVIAGRINLMYTTSVSADAHIKSGRVKVLGVAAPKRQAVLPNVPTLAEEGINNAEATVWFGVSASAKTPQLIIGKLNGALNKALTLPEVKKRLDELGLVVAGGTPQAFAAFLRQEAEKMRGLIKTGRVLMNN